MSRYDTTRNRVISSTQLWFLDLLIREDLLPDVDDDEASKLLAEALRPDFARFFRENSRIAAWLARVEFLRQAVPESNWPVFDDLAFGDILEQICRGKSTVEEVRRVDLLAFLQGRLDAKQLRELRDSAPESVALPSGRRVTLAYEQGRPPVLAARLQDLFGWTETPRLARGESPSCCTSSVPTIDRSRSPTISAVSGRPPTIRSAKTFAADIPSTHGLLIL